MEELLKSIFNQLDDNTIEAIGKQADASPEQAKGVLEDAIPILVGALARNSSTEEGATSLQNALERDHDGSLLDNLGSFLNDPYIANGAGILKHILGEKRQNVEQYISNDAGVEKTTAGKILEMAAPIVMGYLGKKLTGARSGGSGNVIGDILGSVISSGNKGQQTQNQGMIGQILDRDNDGNVTDDIAELGISFLGRLLKRK